MGELVGATLADPDPTDVLPRGRSSRPRYADADVAGQDAADASGPVRAASELSSIVEVLVSSAAMTGRLRRGPLVPINGRGLRTAAEEMSATAETEDVAVGVHDRLTTGSSGQRFDLSRPTLLRRPA